MPLQKSIVSFPFDKGIQQKGSEANSEPGSLKTCENFSFMKNGKLQRRKGFTCQNNSRATITSPSSIDYGNALLKRGDELLIADKDFLWSRTNIDTAKLDMAGKYKHCTLTNDFVETPQRQKQGPAQYALGSNNVEVFFWVEYELGFEQTRSANAAITSYYCYADIRDSITGHFYLRRHLVTTYTRETSASTTTRLYTHPQPQVVNCAGKIYLLYLKDDSGTLRIYRQLIDTTGTPTVSSLTPASETILKDPGVSSPHSNAPLAATPVFSAVACNNARVSNGFVCTWIVASDEARIVTYNSNAESLDHLNWNPTTDGASTHADFVFYALDASAPDAGITTGIQLCAINDDTSDVAHKQYAAFYSRDISGTTFPGMHFFAANLSAYEELDNSVKAVTPGTHVITGTAMTKSDNGGLFIVLEVADEKRTVENNAKSGTAFTDETATGGIGTAAYVKDWYANHQVVGLTYTRGDTDSLAVGKTVTYAGSLTTDAFRYDGKVYFGVSVCHDKFETELEEAHGLNNNLIIHEFDTQTSSDALDLYQPIASLMTGAAPSTYIAEHYHRTIIDTGGRRLLYGIQRVTESGSKFIFGANRFSEFLPYKNPSFEIEAIRGITKAVLDFAPEKLPQSVENQGTLLVTGGFTHAYDGSRVFENEAFVGPVILEGAVEDTNTGGSLAAGVYFYKAVDEYSDANGNVYQSRPSTQVSVTVTSGNVTATKQTINLTLGPWAPTCRGMQNSCAIYRTEPNGSIFYKLAQVKYDTDAGAIMFTDTGEFDTNLHEQEPLYTNGGLPSHECIGSTKDITIHRNRVSCVTADNVIFHSKTIHDVTAARFCVHPAFVTLLNADKRPINGIASTVEHLLVFTRDNGYYITGDGPTDIGARGFSEPRLLSPAVGARPDAPTLLTPIGVIFQSARGIYAIGNELTVRNLGAAVEDIINDGDENQTHQRLVSIATNEKANEIYLALENPRHHAASSASSDTEDILCYNYAFRAFTNWSISTSKLLNGTAPYCRGLVVIDGELFRLSQTGYFQKMQTYQIADSSPTLTYADSIEGTGTSTAYSSTLETNFLNFGQRQERFRVYRVGVHGNYLDASRLIVTLFQDYKTSGNTLSTMTTSSDPDPYHVRAHVDTQKCMAFAVKISIPSYGGSAADDLELESVAFEVARRSPRLKLPATQTLVDT